jgi:hypothetical protein
MEQKIYLSLNDNEKNALFNLISDANSDLLNSLLSHIHGTENTDVFIRHRVYFSLSHLSGKEISDFDDNSNLDTDLKLFQYHKRALKNYFQRIVHELNSNKFITTRECENLKKVSDCIVLVKSKV